MSKNTNLSFLTDYITADITNGRIGINNASPTVAFDVSGATKISGVLTLTSTISNGTYTYTLPSATGTLALTSALSSYLQLTGGTLTGALSGTSATFSSSVNIGTAGSEKLNIFGAGSQFINVKNTTTNADMFVGMSSALSAGFIGTGGSDPLVFSTAGAEKMRIQANGQVKIGTTNNYYADNLVVYAGTNSGEGGITIAAANTSARNFLGFADGTEGEDRYRGLVGYNHADDSMLFYTNANQRMIISSNGSIGAPSGTNIYNASDVRLKKNVSTTTYGLNTISLLNPVKFNWIDGFEPSEDGKDMLGFIAQEIQNVIPEAVESFGSSVDLNGTIILDTLRVNEKFIIPVLVKAIQELSAENTSLKNRIEALENK